MLLPGSGGGSVLSRMKEALSRVGGEKELFRPCWGREEAGQWFRGYPEPYSDARPVVFPFLSLDVPGAAARDREPYRRAAVMPLVPW